MIDRIEVLLRRLHRWFDRSEWSVRLLRLSRTQAPVSAPGLILIQIDGLGRTQLERALAAGRMPFLQRLMKHEDYGLHTLYAGVLPGSQKRVILDAPTRLVDEPSQQQHQGRRVRV